MGYLIYGDGFDVIHQLKRLSYTFFFLSDVELSYTLDQVKIQVFTDLHVSCYVNTAVNLVY